jgi:hypothetical protein
MLFCFLSCHTSDLCLLCTWLPCPLQDIPSSSTWAAGFNATNILAGVGLLATPYAVSISGVGSLALLLLVGG